MDKLATFWKEFLSDVMENSLTNLCYLSYKDQNQFLPYTLDSLKQIQESYIEDLQGVLDKSLKLFEEDLAKESAKVDRRFRDEAWNHNPFFYYLKESYLLYGRLLTNLFNLYPTNKEDQHKINFYLKGYLDAIAPTNFPFTNPEVIRETLKQKGENFVKGYESFLADQQNPLTLKFPPLTDLSAFEVGKTLATTKGTVVYQNELFQLLQYLPSQGPFYRSPLLIIPPWINKYYIFDLQPENSFIKWNVERGRAVYVMSWVNPDACYKAISLADYLLKGIDTAINQVRILFKTPQVNTIGFCVGGVGLLTLMAYYQKKKEHKIASATLLASPVDFREMGDLSFFVSRDYLSMLKNLASKVGGIGGETMMQVFRSLRANELIWPAYINTYLLGKKPKALDFLYWNSDITNLPAQMHLEYLEKFYLGNCLNKVNDYSLNKVGININTIKTPSFILATERDHIVPWKAAYRGFQKLKNSTFVLGGSGHIAGIINPPSQKKYGYRTNETNHHKTTAEQWLKESVYHPNSWWEMWERWIEPFCGAFDKDTQEIVSQPLEAAPGQYALKKASSLERSV